MLVPEFQSDPPYVRHKGDFFPTLFDLRDSFSRENNILPPYDHFQEIDTFVERTYYGL
jgi:hypothetical protein